MRVELQRRHVRAAHSTRVAFFHASFHPPFHATSVHASVSRCLVAPPSGLSVNQRKGACSHLSRRPGGSPQRTATRLSSAIQAQSVGRWGIGTRRYAWGCVTLCKCVGICACVWIMSCSSLGVSVGTVACWPIVFICIRSYVHRTHQWQCTLRESDAQSYIPRLSINSSDTGTFIFTVTRIRVPYTRFLAGPCYPHG